MSLWSSLGAGCQFRTLLVDRVRCSNVLVATSHVACLCTPLKPILTYRIYLDHYLVNHKLGMSCGRSQPSMIAYYKINFRELAGSAVLERCSSTCTAFLLETVAAQRGTRHPVASRLALTLEVPYVLSITNTVSTTAVSPISTTAVSEVFIIA